MIWLFYAANLLALLVWALLIFAPKAHLTRRTASAVWPFVILTIYYLVNLVYTLATQPASALSLETFFALPSGLYAGWTHYLVVDLFVGQHIYRSTSHYNGRYRLNQVLTLLVAPLGVMMYLYRQKLEVPVSSKT
ncbi:MAG: DUF4281 domain-containing protein [Anaerolineae bacterium]|nr:DUF4281 domain-containing protein [Anaerolineae bacterium]